MKSEASSLKTVINEMDFLKETIIIQWNIKKRDLQLFATKLTKKTPDHRNAKEHNQSFIKNIKSIKQSKIIAQQQHTFENQTYLYKVSCYRTCKYNTLSTITKQAEKLLK